MADSESKANDIISGAKQRAGEIMQESVSAGNARRDEILADAEKEAQRTKAQIVSGQTLEMRDSKLKAKQEMIDAIFDESLIALKKLPSDQFAAFVTNYIVSLNIDADQEILLPAQYSGLVLELFNKKLKEVGKKGALLPYKGPKTIDSGFILVRGGVENNNTYEALIDYYREDLEGIVVSNLF